MILEITDHLSFESDENCENVIIMWDTNYNKNNELLSRYQVCKSTKNITLIKHNSRYTAIVDVW